MPVNVVECDDAQFALYSSREERYLRWRVKLMRELGIVVLADLTLGPEPKEPTPLEKLAAKVEAEDTPQARRDLRVAQAREEKRAMIGDFDIPDARIDALLDPAIFELE